MFFRTKVTSTNFLTPSLLTRITLATNSTIYAGYFNAYTNEEIENHITPPDSHALFHRVGDTNPAHSPASPLTTATATAADFRGRLLLNMLNSIELIITNGRFQSPSPNLEPYTFFRKLNTQAHSIVDYILIAIQEGPEGCSVIHPPP